MDLERHRLRHRMNGFPIYGNWEDDEEGVIIGVIVEPDWQWSEMSETDQATIREVAASLIADGRGNDLTWHQAFSYVLGDYGIACPHEWRYNEPYFRECKMCRAVEQLPGIRVMVGERVMRVSDPPPSILRVPVPAAPNAALYGDDQSPTFNVDEYAWNGHAYQKVASR